VQLHRILMSSACGAFFPGCIFSFVLSVPTSVAQNSLLAVPTERDARGRGERVFPHIERAMANPHMCGLVSSSFRVFFLYACVSTPTAPLLRSDSARPRSETVLSWWGERRGRGGLTNWIDVKRSTHIALISGSSPTKDRTWFRISAIGCL